MFSTCSVLLLSSPSLDTLLFSHQEQEEVSRRHEEEVKSLHQKLDLYSDTSLDRFKQNTLVTCARVRVCVRVCVRAHVIQLFSLVTMVILAAQVSNTYLIPPLLRCCVVLGGKSHFNNTI